MAESALSVVLSTLAHYLEDERSFLFMEEVHEEIQLLRVEFLYLDYIVKHVQKNPRNRYGIRNWEFDVVRCAQGGEDLVETCILGNFMKYFQKLRKKLVGRRYCKLVPFVISIDPNRIYNRFYNRDKKMIQAMQHKIQKIVLSLEHYRLQDPNKIVNDTSAFHHQYPPLRERFPSRASRDDVVGFDEQVQTLVERLVNDGPCSLSSISITGMGGVGKTTLAQCIYDNAQLRNHFNVKGCVSISQTFTLKGVLLDLLTELRPYDTNEKANLQRFQVPQLKSILYEYLKQSRYLVVLDDVWSIKAWDSLADLFPDNLKKSRLILTTRNNQVARRTGGYTHSMSSKLEKEESWKLFQLKAFEEVADADPELEEIGQKISREYHDLPLLVVDAGSFLSRKTWTREWQRVQRSMTPLGPRGKVDHVFDILLLSYKDLAPEVRSCFLCLGFFHKEHEIPARKLFHLWTVHGFVTKDQANGIQRIESKCEGYLQEFIDKNLVQAKKVAVNGKVKTVCVHRSIHEFCILRAKDDLFLEVQSGTSLYDHPAISIRHKVILTNNQDWQTPAPNLRSLIFLPQSTSFNKAHGFMQSKLLRVLDLEGLVIKDKKILTRLEKLANLRYLNLRNTSGLKRLHASMWHLHMLLMLDIRGSEIVHGLYVLKYITSLQHVYLTNPESRESKRLNFKDLTQLQTIAWVSHRELQTIEMQKLRMLRKLKLQISSSSTQAWNKIASLTQLESLHMAGEGKAEIIDVLQGFASSIKIKQLKLRHVKVSPQLVSFLAQFPYLMLLRLKESDIEGGCLTIGNNGFTNLRYLELSRLDLGELKLQKGNISLQITECERLSRVHTRNIEAYIN